MQNKLLEKVPLLVLQILILFKIKWNYALQLNIFKCFVLWGYKNIYEDDELNKIEQLYYWAKLNYSFYLFESNSNAERTIFIFEYAISRNNNLYKRITRTLWRVHFLPYTKEMRMHGRLKIYHKTYFQSFACQQHILITLENYFF